MNHSTVVIKNRLSRELSTRHRRFLAAGLLVDLLLITALFTMWWTEPQPLPADTQLLFAALSVAALSWAAVFGWLLACRHVLYVRQKVVTTKLATYCTAAFGILAGTVAWLRVGALAAAPVIVFAGTMFVVAWGLYRSARERRDDLVALRTALEAELG